LNPSNHMRTREWYIAHGILYFEPSAQTISRTANLTVWENLILIKATNPEDAYRKAMDLGHLNEHAVKIDGKDGYCRFKGLRELALVYDELEDGAELEWREFQMEPTKLHQMVIPKAKMQAFKVEPKQAPTKRSSSASRMPRRKSAG
jgi:hypothetical protein